MCWISYAKKEFKPYDIPQPNYLYTTMIGSLIWAALCTQPDIAYAINTSHGPECIGAVKRIVHYLKGTMSHSIMYSEYRSSIEAVGYADAHWAEGHDWKSIYIFIMSGGAVVWSSKKQGTIALSTLEAEYTVISHAT